MLVKMITSVESSFWKMLNILELFILQTKKEDMIELYKVINGTQKEEWALLLLPFYLNIKPREHSNKLKGR